MIEIHLKENGKSLLLNIDYIVSIGEDGKIIDFSENVYEVTESFEDLKKLIQEEENRCLKQNL